MATFELPVTDYLVKTVEYSRFLQASRYASAPSRHARPEANGEQPAPDSSDLFVRVNGQLMRRNFGEILYIKT